MKIGDTIVCHNPCIMIDGGSLATTLGKLYKVIDIRKDSSGNISIVIIDDDFHEHHFAIEDNSLSNGYQFWFYNIKELRRDKLKKIKNKLIEL